MRLAQTVYCILALVAGLVYAPFFHVHDDEHEDEHAELHTHFDASAERARHDDHVRHDDHDDAVAIEDAEQEHHGKAISVFVAQTPEPDGLLIVAPQPHSLIPLRVLHGFVVEQPVRAHDPPRFGPSNPRSPPV